MLSRKYFVSFVAALLLLAGGIVAFAQSPIRGKVQLKQADGKVVPVEGATVDIYRVDTTTGKLPSTKTDAKGAFSVADVPRGQVFAVVVSGPNLKPELTTGIKSGEDVVVIASPGDGTVPSEELVRTSLAESAVDPNSAEGKKRQAEREKQLAEYETKKKKVEESTAVMNRALQEGTKAFEAKNYDLAIVKFEEGFQADPEYVGSAPVLLNNKAIALRQRAVDAYNTGIKSSDATQKTEKVNAARKDFQDSLEAYTKSYQILKSAQPADIKDQNTYNTNKYNALSGVTEVYRLMAMTRMADSSKAAEAKTAFQDYITMETDAAKKAKAQFILADVLRESGDFENAIPEYRKALEAAPDNPDVLAGLGLSLFAVGEEKKDLTLSQEGLNFMERFIKVAPETHPLKGSVNDSVTYLKTERKLTPQKTTTTKKKS